MDKDLKAIQEAYVQMSEAKKKKTVHSVGQNAIKTPKAINDKVAVVQQSASYTPSDKLINAIISHESVNNGQAHGDISLKKGETGSRSDRSAYGWMQIRQPVLDDVNEYLSWQKSPVRYTHEDRFDKAKSIKIFKLYMKRWHPKNDEECARMWNGGPKGHLKTATLRYWNIIKSIMDGMN